MKMLIRRWLSALLLALLFPLAATAQQPAHDKVKWKVLTTTLEGAPGDVVEVKVLATIESGWWIYSFKSYTDGPEATAVTVGDASAIVAAGRTRTSPSPKKVFDEGFEIDVEKWEKKVTFTVPVRISKSASAGTTQQGWVSFYYQACDLGRCMPPTDAKLSFSVGIKEPEAAKSDTSKDLKTAQADSLRRADSLVAVEQQRITDSTNLALAQAAVDSATNSDTTVAPTDTATVASVSGNDANNALNVLEKEGIFSFLLLAAGAGLLALATPCVFPMIPITVSFFTKRNHTTRKRTIRDAGVYSLGIILTFTALGFILTLLLGAAGVTNFATNPWVNIAIAGIFLVLALNLFGMYEIQLPTGLLNRLNRKAEGDGIGSVLMMGLVFSLTSFTCTVPFVGGLLAVSAKTGQVFWPLMGTAVFAAVFSLPFFVLAVFPSMLKSLPRAGGWLNSVKVVMGFLEVAFALKFISNADLIMQWGLLPRELFLSLWVAVAVLITFYLLGRFQLPHDTPVERVGPIRVLLATAFLGLGFWMVHGMFGGNLGELEAQIPPVNPATQIVFVGGSHERSPMAENVSTPQAGAPEMEHGWIKDDYEFALKQAKSTGKPLLVDFTGYVCGNCRWMEKQMFPRKEVVAMMDNFVKVRLYTDRRDAVNKRNQKMLQERYSTISVPYYAVVSANDSTVSQIGYTRSTDEFVDFLQRGATNGTMAMVR